MKHILLIATGGTIASKDNGNGLTPSIDVNILLEYIPAIRHICSVNGISIMNIDSSNMNTDYIARISECIKDNYDNYDGFVIILRMHLFIHVKIFLAYFLHFIAN